MVLLTYQLSLECAWCTCRPDYVGHKVCKGLPAVRPALCPVQVTVLVEQVDAYDKSSSSHACMKGIRAEPQQPELPRLREAIAAADTVVLLAEGADVSPWEHPGALLTPLCSIKGGAATTAQ